MDSEHSREESKPPSDLQAIAVSLAACCGVVLLLVGAVVAANFYHDPQKDFEEWEAGQILAGFALWVVAVVAVVLAACVAATRGGFRRFASGMLVLAALLGIILLVQH